MSYFNALERSQQRKAAEEQKKKKPLICVCIPTRGTFNYRFVFGVLADLLKPDEAFDLDFNVGIQRHSVVVARNGCAEDALRSNPDYLFWIDDDQIFANGLRPRDAIKKLLEVKAPIVAGLTRDKVRDPQKSHTLYRNY